MTTAAPHLEEDTQRAWAAYLAAVRGLEGTDYEEAEHAAWDELQQALETLAAEPAPHG